MGPKQITSIDLTTATQNTIDKSQMTLCQQVALFLKNLLRYDLYVEFKVILM